MNSIERRVVLLGATVLTAGAGFLAIDQDPRSVSADSPTPVSTPVKSATPPPDAGISRIQNALATATALSREEEAAKIEAANRAARERINAILGTPTKTPLPTPTPTPKPGATPTPNIEATRIAIDKAVIQEIADRKVSATARAEQTTDRRVPPTYIPPTEAVPGTTQAKGQTKNQGGELPWGPIGIITPIFLAAYALRTRIPLVRRIPLPGPHF